MSGSTSLGAPHASPVEIGIMMEKIRSCHEEIERLEQSVMEALQTEDMSPVEPLLQGHRLRNMAKLIMLKSEKLVETYEKFEGDIAPLRDQSRSRTDLSSAFSSRLQEILEYHGTHTCAPMVVDHEALSKEESLVEFTREDCFGPYLDLSSDPESGDVCNKKRSVGWDGKPIPYWLDKLGLGQEYRCEICKSSYAGKKSFERHFKEWHHHRELLVTQGKSIEEAILGMPPQRLPWPLGADGKFRRPLDVSQVTDQGTLGNGSNQAPAIPPQVRDVLAAYLAEGERMVAKHLAGATDHSGGGSLRLIPDGDRAASLLFEPHKCTCRVPEGITCKELDVIKLAAQFRALNGGRLWEGCKERSDTDPQFEFMKLTGGGSGSRSTTLFVDLSLAYFEVVNRPEILRETLRENAADMETVLETCFNRLQLDRFLEEHEDELREDKEKAPLDPPPKPQPLVGCVTICVYAPDCSSVFYCEYFDFDMASLSETVASLKEKIAQKVKIPASQHILRGKTGILEDDNKSLAHYNVGALDILDLSFTLCHCVSLLLLLCLIIFKTISFFGF
ncbi:unnamed protein product [Microthlaspi erraticum]|uniref:Ubiquitin-like domain-containing protein n=1 Tax=Microthlaspi erraticum TaxID=1685480 RepID=A0A6D2JV94_9BRAS|nr:unnamed protein product [Microthlaspi erraticum]